MTRLRPFKLNPKLVPKIWGGHHLVDLWHKRSPQEPREKLGESWEVADLPEGQSIVASGPLEGKTLREVVENHPTELLGEGDRTAFPLLVKLLDAADDLSVQVHPGKQHEGVMPGARSKDEAWVILHTQPGGAILHGLKEGVTREDFSACVASGGDPPQDLAQLDLPDLAPSNAGPQPPSPQRRAQTRGGTAHQARRSVTQVGQ